MYLKRKCTFIAYLVSKFDKGYKFNIILNAPLSNKINNGMSRFLKSGDLETCFYLSFTVYFEKTESDFHDYFTDNRGC